MWDIKLKATNEQTNKQKLTDTDDSMVVARGKGGVREVEEGKGGHIRGDRRRFGFGEQTHNATYRRCVIELYT